jgi:hypothetical protein
MLLSRRRCSPLEDGGRSGELTAKHEDGDDAAAPGSRKGRAGPLWPHQPRCARPRQRHIHGHTRALVWSRRPDQPRCASHVVPVLTALLWASRTRCDGRTQEEARAAGPRCRAGDEARDGTRDARGLNARASGWLLAAGRRVSEPLATRWSRAPWALLAARAQADVDERRPPRASKPRER